MGSVISERPTWAGVAPSCAPPPTSNAPIVASAAARAAGAFHSDQGILAMVSRTAAAIKAAYA